jgi:hypothetical protein
MGRQQNHRDKWKSNRAFLQELPEQHADWAAVVVFYTALHAVEWLMASDGVTKPTSHKTRDMVLANSRYAPIRKAYDVLKNVSWMARYEAAPAARKSLTIEQVQGRLIDKYLMTIEAFVLAEVDPKGSHKPKPIRWPPES